MMDFWLIAKWMTVTATIFGALTVLLFGRDYFRGMVIWLISMVPGHVVPSCSVAYQEPTGPDPMCERVCGKYQPCERFWNKKSRKR